MDPYKDTSFEQAIYNKKEFNDLKVTKEDEKENTDDTLFKHQKVISRFLSAHTSYDGLFLFHEMGTGKTCAAFGSIENLRATDNRYTNALVITSSNNVLNSLINELATVCTKNVYLPQDINISKLSKSDLRREILKLTTNFYKFHTVRTLASVLERKSDAEIVNDYSNTIIVVDEVHNIKLYGKGDGKNSSVYNQLYRLLHLPKNCKKIIMSGTPMTDLANQIASVMNLILPVEANKKFPIPEEFQREYLHIDEDGITRLNMTKIDDFKNKIRGYVSYLKASLSDIETKYKGEVVKPLIHFKVYQGQMSNYQAKGYNIAYQKYVKVKDAKEDEDEEEDEENEEEGEEEQGKKEGFYQDAKEASLFVYPSRKDKDGKEELLYGREGFKTYMKGKKNYFTLSHEIKKLFDGKTDNEKLEILREFSSTYANTIEAILENNKKNTLVFNSIVKGSGALLFTKLLELFGFQEAGAIIDKKIKQKRYALITGTEESRNKLEIVKQLFNDDDNKYGDFIQVIVFSKVAAEGISFKNVQEIHVQTPHWNYSETSQVIARGLRLRSHQALIAAKMNPVVTIYQHCAIANEKDKMTSIDMIKYFKSERKDISVKNIEHYIKESAVDCALFYERNVVTSENSNGTRACDYMDCNYTCDGITEMNLNPIDTSTFQLYYSHNKINDIISRIVQIFRQKFSMSINHLYRDETLSQYTMFELFLAIRKLIAENIVLTNAYGFGCYLREKNNILFLTENLSIGSDFLCASYTRYPIGVKKSSLSEAIDNEIVIKRLLPNLRRVQSQEDADKILPFFPVNWQQKLIEKSLQNPTHNLSHFVIDYFRRSRTIISEASYKLKDKMYVYDPSKNEWTETEIIMNVEIPDRTCNDSGYVGLEDPDKRGVKGFKIWNVRKVKEAIESGKTKTAGTGEQCSSFKNPPKGVLLTLIGAELTPKQKQYIEQILSQHRRFTGPRKDNKEILYDYLQKFNDKITNYYPKDSSYDWIEKGVVFNDMTSDEQCQLLYDTFSKTGFLFDNPQIKTEGYGAKRLALVKPLEAATNFKKPKR
jgi:hypothetical protein